MEGKERERERDGRERTMKYTLYSQTIHTTLIRCIHIVYYNINVTS